jgi:aldose sugar dehydrogenase
MSRLGYFLAVGLMVSACGGSGSPPGSSNPPGGTQGERISGNERLGWGQHAGSRDELGAVRFVAYVDGNRVELNGVACTVNNSPFDCTSRMPSMSPGTHTIELASYVMDGGQLVESGRSEPLRVTLVSTTPGADPPPTSASQQVTSDGVALRMDVIGTGVHAVTALAFSKDGLLFIGERSGRIFIEPAAQITPASALTANAPTSELSDVHLPSPDAGGLLALALDPGFERTRFVYALYTVEARDGSARFRVARFREANRELGERAVLLETLVASPERPAGALAFGADAKLFVTFDDGGDGSPSVRSASYNGKLLRLNTDGTTPADQPGATPIVESDLRSPRGFDWHPGSGALWLADRLTADKEALHVRAASSRSRAPVRALYALPSGTDAAAVAFATGALMPEMHGDLFVASREGRHLLRLRIDRRDAMRVIGTERLFADAAGRVNTVVSGPDGALYLGTDTAVLRIGPG